MVPGIGGFGGLFPLGITNFIHLQLIIAYEYASVGGVILEVFYFILFFFPLVSTPKRLITLQHTTNRFRGLRGGKQ